MKIHEYQAKALLAAREVPVPRGRMATTPEEAGAAAAELGGRVVVKAQIHAGGRGKGRFRTSEGQPVSRPGSDQPQGGVIVVEDAAAAEAAARAMLGRVLVTRQTGEAGQVVRRLLVEEGMAIAREFYLAMLLDRARRAPIFIASTAGGTEIEEVAASRPEAILRVAVDPRVGFSPWIGRRLAFDLGLSAEGAAAVAKLVRGIYRAFVETDASLVEINPLIETRDGRVLALDAKMTFDDNALFRQPEIRALRDEAEEDPLEVEASRHGLNYIKLDGTVGCMVNGAGLAMATMDIIKHYGASPANFLDVGGGATAEMVARAFRILLGDRHVRAVLINIFGGIMRCDVVAEGVVAAAREVGIGVPLVVRLEGTNVERGREILRQSGLALTVATGMEDAARKVVAAAAAGGR